MTVNAPPMYMFACDHRWQWEEYFDAHVVPRERIPHVKRLAFDGYLLARERSAAVRDYGALLVDELYGSEVIADALAAGIRVATPAEKPGAVPLEWATDPFFAVLTGTIVKVLVRYRPDDGADVQAGQWTKLDALQTWCRTAGKPLLIEVIVARKGEPEAEFEATGRPGMLAGYIADAYRRGLTPEYWKIEGSLTSLAARIIDAAIAANPSCRQIILGKAASLATIDRWFAACAASATAAGFAIGRSVYWEPAAAFLAGTTTAKDAADVICSNYLQLIDAWERSRS